MTDLVWNTEDMPVAADLRRMACRLCGFQVNGQRFFKMVAHLEEKHDKYQQCRAYKLDFFVKFGCGQCPQFECDSVHTWDKHFLDDYCTKCVASGFLRPRTTGAAKAEHSGDCDAASSVHV